MQIDLPVLEVKEFLERTEMEMHKLCNFCVELWSPCRVREKVV